MYIFHSIFDLFFPDMLCYVKYSLYQHPQKTFNELKIIHRCAVKRIGNRGGLRYIYVGGGGYIYISFSSVETKEGKRRKGSKRKVIGKMLGRQVD